MLRHLDRVEFVKRRRRKVPFGDGNHNCGLPISSACCEAAQSYRLPLSVQGTSNRRSRYIHNGARRRLEEPDVGPSRE